MRMLGQTYSKVWILDLVAFGCIWAWLGFGLIVEGPFDNMVREQAVIKDLGFLEE